MPKKINPEKYQKELQQIAKKQGGKCLSNEYINSQTKLLWQCKKGHQWHATPNLIKNLIKNSEVLCPKCRKIKKSVKAPLRRQNIKTNHVETKCNRTDKISQLKIFQDLAQQNGGQLLASIYTDSMTKVSWQCAKGHIWQTTPMSIKNGSWCPECRLKEKKQFLIQCQKLAQSNGGQCLSPAFVSATLKLKWQCSDGHEFRASLLTVNSWLKKGFFCPCCTKQENY